MTERFRIDEETAFYGRTFREYRRMFALDRATLADATVLDCPGGPGSFPAVASALAAEVTAVDPSYGAAAEQLARRCEETIERTER